MFKLGMFRFLNSIVTGFAQRSEIVTNFFTNPYTELSKQAKEVARGLTYPQVSKWQYEIDSTSGLKILVSEKDAEALDRVRQIADELLK